MQICHGGRSLNTDERAPTTVPSPMVTPGATYTSAAIQARSPIWNRTPIPEIARRRWLWRLVPYLADPEAMLWVNDQDAFHENAIANAPTSSDSLQAAAHSRMGPPSGPWRDSGGYLPHGSPRPAAARHAGNDCVSAAVFCWGLLATAPVTKHGHEHIDSYVTIVVGITAS